MSPLVNRYGAVVILACLFLLTLVLYWPALDSRFVLDDYYNLKGLEEVKDKGITSFVFGGIAGPSGRPLSLLSFAPQHASWPANPLPFKRVNLIIHLLCGILVYGLARQLTGFLGFMQDWRRRAFPVLLCGLFLLHPMQISTVLYTVQRMTELVTLFTLAGLLGYLHARAIYDRGRRLAGLAGMSTAVGAGLVAGVLAKENGILLPLYILVLEFTVLADRTHDAAWRIWAWLFLGLPLLALALYLAATFGGTLEGYQMRPFTMTDRLLTQPVVLLSYLKDLLIPHPSAFTLYHDDFPVSTGLLNPPWTLPCLLLLAALATGGLVLRRIRPAPAFGILWFLAGHSLEASHLGLEMYFEHRNYLPGLGVLFTVSWFGLRYWHVLARPVMPVLLGAYCLLITSITWMETRIWADPLQQAVEWARIHPRSPRAIDSLGDAYLVAGDLRHASEAYNRILEFQPHDIYPRLKQVTFAYCIEGRSLDDAEWEDLFQYAREAKPYSTAAMAEFDAMIRWIYDGDCGSMEIVKLIRLIIILAMNPDFAGYKGPLHQFAAMLAIEVGDPDSALANAEEAVRQSPTTTRLMILLRIYMALDMKGEAQATMAMLNEYFAGHRRLYLSNRGEYIELEQELETMPAETDAGDSSSSR